MEPNSEPAVYVRRTETGYVPVTEEGQGAVVRAQLAALGLDAEPPRSAAQFAIALGEAAAQHDAARAGAVLATYRPHLVERFGEEITARVMGHRFLHVFLADMGAYDLEPDEAVTAVAEYLHGHPEATVAEAFNAVRDDQA